MLGVAYVKHGPPQALVITQASKQQKHSLAAFTCGNAMQQGALVVLKYLNQNPDVCSGQAHCNGQAPT